jgi:hypothetical protein
MEDIHAVCHARTIFYPDKAEQVIETILKNPEKTCSMVHASATQQGGFRSATEPSSKSICPLGGSHR